MMMAIQRQPRAERWHDEQDEADGRFGPGGSAGFKPLTREEASALRARLPPLSPWRVVGMQAAVGVLAALLAALLTGRPEWAWSMLYGAAAVVVPGALMARGMTSPLSKVSLGASVVSFTLWEFVKIGVSVAMLMLAPKLVQPLSWPALLVGLVLCLKVYVVAVLWFSRRGVDRVHMNETQKNGR